MKTFVYLWKFVAYEAQISGIFGASDSQTTCIFANLRDIRGQNHLYICKSPGYLQISYIQGLKENKSPGYSCITWKSWISWIISNLLDNLECPGYSRSMNCKLTGYSQLIKNKSPGYSGPMKFESYGSLQISLTFGGLRLNLMDIPDLWSANLLNIWGLWSANLLDIWDLWRANLMDICKSPGHSWISWIFGAYEAQIPWIFGAYEVRLSRMFAKLLDIQGLWSAGCSGPV